MKLYIKVDWQISGADDDHLSTFIGLLLLSGSILLSKGRFLVSHGLNGTAERFY